MRVSYLLLLPLIVFSGPARAAQMCIVPDDYGLNVTVHCPNWWEPPTTWDNACIGYRESGFPCSFGVCGEDGELLYRWTISRSPSDPLQNAGVLPGTPTELYLWVQCIRQTACAAEFGVVTSPDLRILDFRTLNGWLNAGSATALLLARDGEQSGPGVVGRWKVVASPAVSTKPTSWGVIRSRYR